MTKEKYLHFEDNEVYEIVGGKKKNVQTFDSPKEAREAFDAQVHQLNIDENYRIEFVPYFPEFPPQRLKVMKKS